MVKFNSNLGTGSQLEFGHKNMGKGKNGAKLEYG